MEHETKETVHAVIGALILVAAIALLGFIDGLWWF